MHRILIWFDCFIKITIILKGIAIFRRTENLIPSKMII